LGVFVGVPLLVLYGLAATHPDENVVLSRNQVLTDASGARTWHGTMLNRTDSPYRDVVATIRFLGADDQSVGQISGVADHLKPGEMLNLQAPLPPQAVRMQVYSLQWRTGHVGRLLGPWAPWSFGYVQYDPSE
jgi:hypothetical protein